MKEIAHLTHFDADALGCCLHLDYATPNIPKITFSTNYRDLDEKVSDTFDYCLEHNPDLLVISDVSFGNNIEQLRKLASLHDMGIKILFIDHHAYPDNFFDEFKTKMGIHWNITKSATLIAENVFKTNNDNLIKLSNIINIYDIWVEESETFPLSMAMNDYFWEVQTKLNSLDKFTEIIKNNDYKLPGFKKWFKKYTTSKNKFIQNLKRKKLLMSDGFFAVVFTDEYFNEVLYEEFKQDTQFVMICNSYGIIRYRTKRHGSLSDTQKEDIKQELIGTLEIGHLNAYSTKLQNHNFEKMMSKVQEVQQKVNKYKGQ